MLEEDLQITTNSTNLQQTIKANLLVYKIQIVEHLNVYSLPHADIMDLRE